MAGPPPRLRVGVIGAGRVGSVLGAAWRRAGHHIVGVSAVSDMSRLRAEALLPGVPLRTVPEICAEAELILFAVPDDVLPDLVRGLVAAEALTPGTFLVHVSGRHGLAVFEPAPLCVPLAIHPVMTFTGTSIDLERLSGAPCGVTAPEDYRTVAEALTLELGAEPVWVPESVRVRYHAALSYASNFMNTLVSQASDLLEQQGMNDPARLLAPLLHASLDNALRLRDRGLTGPIARGDAESIARHLEVLDDPVVAASYRAMGRLAADRALGAGVITVEQAAALLTVLATRSE
jgi:predicted short-subunit dehydrogenase-like oxidoreductase (DUF2520 family)